MSFITDDVKFTIVQAALADGQTDPDSSRVDMTGYDGVCFICTVGTITGSGTVTMAAKSAATDIAGAAISGAEAVASGSSDSDKLLIVDVYKPAHQYVGVTLTRATANSVVGGVVAIQYKGKARPITQPTASLAADVVQVAV